MKDIKKYEINDEALEIVTGGKLTAEAQDWYSRNYSTICKRMLTAYSNQGSGHPFASAQELNFAITQADVVYDLNQLKTILKSQGVSCDDLK